MSKRRKRPEPPRPDPNDENAVWVMSDLAPFGGYICTVLRGDRVLLVLSPDQALRYVAALAKHLAQAEHDAMVTAQLRHIGIDDMKAVASLVVYLRENRVSPPPEDTAPMTFKAMVSARDLRPRLEVSDGTGESWQWDPDGVHQHMRHVLEVSAGVDLDQAYYTALTSFIGLDEPTARSTVTHLAQHRTNN